jgi:hypothetical protein
VSVKKTVRQVVRQLGYEIIKTSYLSPEAFPPGHFYSAIPSLPEVMERASAIFSKSADIRGIESNIEAQIQTLKNFKAMEANPAFYLEQGKRRFNIENDNFSYDDAPILHCMMRQLRPKKVIEIGSGNSSACMLDTSEFYLSDSVEFSFIDPNCDNLRKNLLEKDFARITILEQPIQKVDLSIFSALRSNDLLFVDSSHVMKVGSDLHTILFEVLPMLSPGVCIHFHDVRYPFQYPKDDVMNGVFWNEAYLLRAFLMNNENYEIAFWLNCLINAQRPEVTDLLEFFPLSGWAKRFNKGVNDFSSAGGSIYITKRR